MSQKTMLTVLFCSTVHPPPPPSTRQQRHLTSSFALISANQGSVSFTFPFCSSSLSILWCDKDVWLGLGPKTNIMFWGKIPGFVTNNKAAGGFETPSGTLVFGSTAVLSS